MFAITADQLKHAHQEGMNVACGSAVERIVTEVNQHLIERSQKMQTGEDVSTTFIVTIKGEVTQHSQVHQQAVKLAVEKLNQAGFKAKHMIDCWDEDAICITV